MLKFLNKIFGKSSTSYENLMNSKSESNNLDDATIAKAVALLQPLIKEAHALELISEKPEVAPKLEQNSWPVNSKGEPLTYYGSIRNKDAVFELFKHHKSFIKNEKNVQVYKFEKTIHTSLNKLTPATDQLIAAHSYKQVEILSLPIWEELIHRDLNTHKAIVALASENPWTLYKKAKKKLCNTEVSSGYLGGYPQWMINNMDYRKLETLEFQLQLSFDKEHAYYFLNNEQLQSFTQAY